MRMEKILPIEIKPMVTSECWTYYKFAILQTVNSFDYWLSTHMAICMDNNGRVLFGENGSIYPLSYYSEILSVSEKKYGSISKSDIIDFLICEIDKGNYVILDVNYNKIANRSREVFRFHETLIYGYNKKEKVFYSPILSNGIFRQEKISFDCMAESYGDAVLHFMNNMDERQRFNRRQYFCGITIITPQEVRWFSNIYYDFISRMSSIISKRVFITETYGLNIETKQIGKYYTGLSCFLKLSELIEINSETENALRWFNIADLSCVKLFEYRNMIIRKMKWYVSAFKEPNKEMIELIETYEDLNDEMKNIMLMNEKCYYSRNIEILKRIGIKLKSIYETDHELIEQFLEHARKMYTSGLLEF